MSFQKKQRKETKRNRRPILRVQNVQKPQNTGRPQIPTPALANESAAVMGLSRNIRNDKSQLLSLGEPTLN